MAKKKLPSEEYWTKRAALTLVHNEKSELEYEKDLNLAYKRAINHVKKEIQAFFERYAREEGLTTADVRKSLNPKQLKSFKEQHQYYLAEVEKYGADPAYKQYLKKLSARAYISRLEELITNIRHEIEILAAKQHSGLTKVLKDGYEDGFYRTVFDLQKQVGVGVSFSKPGKATVEKAAKTKWYGRNYSDSVWRNKQALVVQLNQLIPQAFAAGRTSHDLAEQLDQKLQSGFKAAKRLARTEINFISNQAALDGYKASGVVTHYKYLATLDDRTTEECQDMDGKIIKLSEAQVGVNLPPLHAHCRSTTIPYFEDDDIGKLIDDRVARNEEGNTYKVGQYVTYEEWVNNYAEASYAKRVTKAPEKYAQVNADVPVTLDTNLASLKNYAATAEKWEQAIVKGVRQLTDEDIELIGKTMRQLIENNEFAMRVPSTVLNKILADGKFKNQFETGTSGGALNRNAREAATKQLFGSDTTSMSNADFEKYGYLAQKDFAQELKDHMYEVAQYGDVRIVFDKKKLMNRTTFTTEDSLGPAMRRAMVAGDVNNPRANGTDHRNLFGLADKLKKIDDRGYYRDVDIMHDPINFSDAITYGSYIELQYHGQVTTNDIEKIQMTTRAAMVLLSSQRKLSEQMEKESLKKYNKEPHRLSEEEFDEAAQSAIESYFEGNFKIEVYKNT